VSTRIMLRHISKTLTSPRQRTLARLASRAAIPELVVSDISMTVREGEIICIVGASGSGKSTLLKTIAGIWEPDPSPETLASIDIAPAGRRNRVWLPQRATLVDLFTVRRNIAIGARLLASGSEQQREIDRVLDLVELAQWQSARPFELSGGMQQRVALARALVTKRPVLLLDEPFSGLDLTLRRRIAAGIKERVVALGGAAIFTSHTIEESVEVATRIYVLAGRPATINAVVRAKSSQSDDICEAVDVSCGTPREMLSIVYDRIAKADNASGEDIDEPRR